MKKTILTACVVSGGLLGFSSAPVLAQGDAAAPLKVYAAGEISVDRYTVVKRLWTQDLRSLFYVPQHSTSGEGIAALVSAASSVGASGLVNVYCLNEASGHGGPDSFLCYGLAVRTK